MIRMRMTVVRKRFGLVGKLWCLFSRYPAEPGVKPQSFANIALQHDRPKTLGAPVVMAIQSVQDKFYFLLLGAIRARLDVYCPGRAELIVVRGVNGAVGVGWLAEIKRSALVAWLWTSPWVRAFGVLVDGVGYRSATWMNPVGDLADWFRSKLLWQRLQQRLQQGQELSLKIDGIEVADLLVDSYLRFKPSPEFDAKDPFVRRLVWQAQRDVRQANAFFSRVRPRWYLTTYTTYLEHGIPTRAAIQNGVDVWAFGSLHYFGKKLTLADPYGPPDCSGYRATFETIGGREEKLEAAREHLAKRLAGGIDAATCYMRQSAYGQADVELPGNCDGAVVVFLHDFYDSPHVYPDLIFDDYWQWACFTIEVLEQSGINFFLKQHPNQIGLSGEALGRLRAKYPSLQWLPAGVSNVRLAQAGIACGITVYGTVAHELAYLGVPSIACARHPHHAFDFCRTARTREEYKGMLKTYGVMPLPKAEMQRQALAFYYMHNLHGTRDERELQQAFVAFWRACNVGEAAEDTLIRSFNELIKLAEFDRFVKAMVNRQNERSEHFA
jgi:hypothetical protein